MASAVFINSLAAEVLTTSNFSAILIAIAAFATTNVDDLFLLASLFVDAEFPTISVVAGQFLGMSFLIAISILAALLALTIPSGWFCLLGLAPLLLGFNRLWKLFKGLPKTGLAIGNRADFVGKEHLRFSWASSKTTLVVLLTMANGGDNLSVYIPLFSVQRTMIPLDAIIFGVMTALWCLFGYYLTSHRLFGNRVNRWGRFIAPFILIGIGLTVLSHFQDSRRKDQEALGYLHSRQVPKNSSEWRISEYPYRFSILRSTFSTGQESIMRVTRPHAVQIIWS
jgi:cadmium resistance protein CadD (predicted permease)